MAEKQFASTGKRRRRKDLSNFTIVCPHLTDEKKETTTTYTLLMPSSSTTLSYHGENINVNVSQFDTLRVLGRGYYGFVTAVTIEGHPDVQMAVKRIVLEIQDDRRFSTDTDLTAIQNVGSQNYPFIISYYGAVIDRETCELLICEELMDASMDRFYEAMHSFDNVTYTELDRVLCRLTHNITSALHFLEVRQILHRNVKPQNMLVNKQSVFKLCDFGTSREMHPIRFNDLYLRPELIGGTDQAYDIRADMWALGLSLLEIAAGKGPFANMSTFQILMTIQTWTPTIPSNLGISNDMKQLITHLLKQNVEERPKTYLENLEIPSIRDVSENPSDEEKKFVIRVLDNIPICDV